MFFFFTQTRCQQTNLDFNRPIWIYKSDNIRSPFSPPPVKGPPLSRLPSSASDCSSSLGFSPSLARALRIFVEIVGIFHVFVLSTALVSLPVKSVSSASWFCLAVDEEPKAVNNPQKLPVSSDGQGLKRGTRVGEGATREVAAYVLDHPKSGLKSLSKEVMGFAGVPPTAMVRSSHKVYNYPKGFNSCTTKDAKVGSLQMFMKNNESCEDIDPGAFPVEEVHKICVFDIRMCRETVNKDSATTITDGSYER